MSHRFKLLSFCVLGVGLLLGLLPLSGIQAQQPTRVSSQELALSLSKGPKAKIEALVLSEVKGEAQTDFFIWMGEQADLSPADELPTKEEKGRFVYETLRETAERTQQGLREHLDAQGIAYRPFYISNKVLVRGGSESLLMSMAARPDVARITANHQYQLPEPRRNDKTVRSPQEIEPNLTFVNADDVWQLGITGEGIVLAGNDTGLQWDHPAIINQYRGWDGSNVDHNYNWWDASGLYPDEATDGAGHGTHTTGTMIGHDGDENQIGMAPGAQTIHCKNMDDFGGGSAASFIECFEWDLAPWDLNRENPRPDLAPDAVNNSWGFPGGDPQFKEEVAALQAAGILIEASAGNSGPFCGTLGSPGDYAEVLTTGSVDHSEGALPGTLTVFSSRGPSFLAGESIPDIMAPGENVRSSVPGGDYQAYSGTSMSGPHVVGLIGLLWQANPALRGQILLTNQLIKQTSVPLSGQSGSNCGGDYDQGPNNDWGYGTIDALAAVQAAQAYGDPGTLQGKVSNSSTGEPVSGVTVKTTLPPDLVWTRLTDEAGLYSMIVFSGTHAVSAELYGYYPQTIMDTQVTSFNTTTLDIALEPAPFYTVTGKITDANTGWPLYASMTIDGYPGDAIWSDPTTGEYSISLAAGVNYTFHVTPWMEGYEASVPHMVGSLSDHQQVDLALDVNLTACTAPGRQGEFVYFENFDTDNGNFTTEGNNSSWEWGTPTNGPGEAHSGEKLWATNLSGNYNESEMSYLVSPEIDLSAYPNQTIILTWWEWVEIEPGLAFTSVEVSNDGGFFWLPVYGGGFSDSLTPSWQKQSVILDSSYAISNFRMRFALTSEFFITQPGFYVDDVGIGVAESAPTYYTMDFEASNGDFVAAGENSSWAWGTPTRGPTPTGAHSGSNAWATNLDGSYNNSENSTLTSPDIDLTAGAGKLIELSWWQWLQTESTFDTASVEVSNDGGTTWMPMLPSISGPMDQMWTEYRLMLDPSYAVPNFRVRFTLQSDSNVAYLGFYVDDLKLTELVTTPPRLPCNTQAGNLLVGHVYDVNTSQAINGATVTHESGLSSLSVATPLDNSVTDGFYHLFSPTGTHSLSVSKSKYRSETLSVTVPISSSNAIQQDINLATGLLSADSATLSATLNMGESANVSFTLNNTGGLEAEYKLRERERGLTPARAAQRGAPLQRIAGDYTMAFSNRSDGPSAPLRASFSRSNTTVQSAAPPWTEVKSHPVGIWDNTGADYEGQIYSIGGLDETFQLVKGGYVYDPEGDSWTKIADMASSRQKPSAAFVEELLYVVGGWDQFGESIATLEIYDPTTDSWSTGAEMPAAVTGAPGVALDGQFYVIAGCADGFCTTTDAVYRYDPSSDRWETVAPYPVSTAWNACGAIEGMIYCTGGADGITANVSTYAYDPGSDSWTQLADMPQTNWAGTFAAANGKLYLTGGITDDFTTMTNETFVYDPTSDSWSQEANVEVAVYRGAGACGFYKIGGFSESTFGPTSTVEHYPELTECGVAPDVMWMSSDVLTGTIGAGGNQTVSVTIDASGAEINQPGDYMAELRFSDNTPYRMDAVSVMMRVNPPADWGKVSGIVTGLAHCDATGAPMHKGSVMIEGVTALQTASDGAFGYWMPAGEYNLTVSGSGYISQTHSISVSAGQTVSQTLNLRPDAPCSISSTEALSITVNAGESTTATLMLNNTGAGTLSYQILESELDLSTTTSAGANNGRGLADAKADFSSTMPSGPLSVRSQADLAQNAILSTPESNWFAGADVPGGVLRYAHAQCAEQPDSFYIISGIGSSSSGSKEAWRYDVADNSWHALADFPEGQEGASATCYQGKIYVMGGGGTNQFYIYDIINNSWQAGAELPRKVWGAAAGAWNGKVYLIGGDSNASPGGTSNEVNIYDIATNSWNSTGTTMPSAALLPGSVQMGPYLYLVGGWGDESPESNLTVTQRYDMSHDRWENGPEFSSARADFALSATDQALYAIGGDKDGGSPFDGSTTVERLALADWPNGSWSELEDALPVATTANSAGFCTSGFFPTQIWSVGGMSNFTISGNNRFMGLSDETCHSIYQDVSWLSATPATGSITESQGEQQITININSNTLSGGTHQATLVITTNDAGTPQYRIPVNITMTNGDDRNMQLYFPMIYIKSSR